MFTTSYRRNGFLISHTETLVSGTKLWTYVKFYLYRRALICTFLERGRLRHHKTYTIYRRRVTCTTDLLVTGSRQWQPLQTIPHSSPAADFLNRSRNWLIPWSCFALHLMTNNSVVFPRTWSHDAFATRLRKASLGPVMPNLVRTSENDSQFFLTSK